MAIFVPKPWVNPFRKMSSFRLFELLSFIVQKGIFFILEYRKRYFPGLYCIRRKVGKISIFGPIPQVNSFGKMSIFRLFELLVFIAQKGIFFILEYRKRHFLVYIALKKGLEKKPWVTDPFRKMSIFQLFELLIFVVQKGIFFHSRIS